ncbi:NADPH-dependent FMN reductase [Pedobacter cryotolerans]|uniref:NAD(P)H-dependent oxidoreductase n=1 Tax=Pedobacter cryotolerans TaxID=2571270 RepID=A0A4U1BUY1_9SPHI|nr:NADPH-dependent FMN reductase [Pedobacter cryotolerans]TKB96490.1 NAD(P)H-dependent oxidoreductase [Pedobacter cryotolerans]
MKNISIISSSVRNGRNSHRVALYFKNYLEENDIADVKIIDLKTLDFPIFEERLKFISEPTEAMLSLADDIKNADGIIVVTPEYNGGYPASLKNVIDLLYAEWKRKPIGIATVSAGAFAGSQVITSLQFTLWKIGALVVPAMFPVAMIDKTFDENGNPSDKEATDKKAKSFVAELIWWIEAKQKME